MSTSTEPTFVLQRLTALAAAYQDDTAAQQLAREEAERQQEAERRTKSAEHMVRRAKKFIDRAAFATVLAPAVMGQDWTGYPSLDGGWKAEGCAVLQLAEGLWLRFGVSPDGDLGGYLVLVAATVWDDYREIHLRDDASLVRALGTLAPGFPNA
jgi:hypothetical protein